MFARVTPPWVALALAAVLVAGCGKNAPAPPPTPQIALVANGGGFGDHGFNDSARGALEECGRQTTVVLATAAPTNTAGIEPKLVLFATEKFDTVIGIGYPAAPAMAAAARRFEGTHFVIIDAVVDEPNVESITFDEPQGAFLAGALAALVSKTHRVAFVADVPLLERSEAGFTAGAREIDPRVEVENRYLASFTDAAAARAAAGALLARGVDILFVVAGPAGRGAIAAIERRPHAYAIGADTDQDGLAPGRILTSVVKHVDVAALRVCIETAGGKPESGHRVLGLADGGIGLTDFRYTKTIVGTPAIARLERLRAAIVAGRVRVPASRAELAHFAPVTVL